MNIFKLVKDDTIKKILQTEKKTIHNGQIESVVKKTKNEIQTMSLNIEIFEIENIFVGKITKISCFENLEFEIAIEKVSENYNNETVIEIIQNLSIAKVYEKISEVLMAAI